MPLYVTRPPLNRKPRQGNERLDGDWELWELDQEFLPDLTVFEDDVDTWTGLYDEHGDELHRIPEREMLGFDIAAVAVEYDEEEYEEDELTDLDDE